MSRWGVGNRRTDDDGTLHLNEAAFEVAGLRATNEKFQRRFRSIEDALRKRGKSPAQSNLAEMDALWNEAKAAERKG